MDSQSQFGYVGEEKNFLPPARIQTLGHPAPSLVTTLTTLSQLFDTGHVHKNLLMALSTHHCCQSGCLIVRPCI
jgi:hypothetical protein